MLLNKWCKSPPGITGLGSVIFRDEEKLISDSNDIHAAYRDIFGDKGELEKWYQQHFSFLYRFYDFISYRLAYLFCKKQFGV